MSKFCQDLPSFSEMGSKKKAPITIFLRPNTNEKEFYRFRLLNFRSEVNDRGGPFIKRWVHTHWGKTDQGKNVVDDTVVCTTTEYVPFNGPNSTKARRSACPMCRHDDENFTIWKMSGWKDKIAMKKHFQMQRQFQGIVPVYVVSDPHNPKNNDRLKCFIISDPKEFDEFIEVIRAKMLKMKRDGDKYNLFNAKNAVDFYLHMDMVPELRNKGKANETTVDVRKITKMTFGKKAYDIPAINDDLLSNFDFDEQYYVSNTADEIDAFYKKHYSISANAPEDDLDSLVDETPKTSGSNMALEELSTQTPDPVSDDVDIDVDNILGDEPQKSVKLEGGNDVGDQTEIPDESQEEDSISGAEVDSLLDELDRV